MRLPTHARTTHLGQQGNACSHSLHILCTTDVVPWLLSTHALTHPRQHGNACSHYHYTLCTTDVVPLLLSTHALTHLGQLGDAGARDDCVTQRLQGKARHNPTLTIFHAKCTVAERPTSALIKM